VLWKLRTTPHGCPVGFAVVLDSAVLELMYLLIHAGLMHISCSGAVGVERA